MKIRKKSKEALSFSKILATFSILIVIIVLSSFFHINNKIMSGEIEYYDFTAYMYLIPSSFALCAATFGFYYNKAKFENVMKIRFGYVKDLIAYKKRSGLYTKFDMESQVDNAIMNAESEVDNILMQKSMEAEQDEEINV